MRAPGVASAIRPATPADGPELERLAATSFAEYDAHAARTVRQMMSRHGSHTWVAEEQGTPIGFVVVEPDAAGAVSVSAIAVGVRQRGRGVGERLMRAAERHARARGATTLTLTTAQANVAALSLFLRLGFRIHDRGLRRYAGAQPACEVRKPLT